MAGNVIGTSSYSEAMDLSDLEDCGYDQEDCVESPENSFSQISPTMTNLQQSQEQQHEQQSNQQEPPVKIRKKPGRKPNPASPALRKAQNRAAQRAFRERKERHMKDLESNIRGIKDHRDKLLQDNEKMSSENEILKAENWYLKGIVLSLQLVCLQHNLVIPQHCPHVNDETLSVLAQSIPESISSYLNVNSKSKLQISQKLMNESPELSNLNLQTQQSPLQHPQPQQQPHPQHPQPQQQPHPQHPQPQQQSFSQQQPFPHQLPSGSLIITQDGIHKIPTKHGNNSPVQQQQQNTSSWYHQQSNLNGMSNSQPQHPFNNNNHYGSPSSVNTPEDISNIPPLSPMSSSTATTDRDRSDNVNKNVFGTKSSRDLPVPRSTNIVTPTEPITSNLAAIQTLRLRLRLQSACVRMQSIPFAIQPTLLQLTIPHDPRIDLVPTPHMRDRMILYRDQFDLDDCFRCLLSGSVFHGGDPGVAGNWQLPEEFFKKYWFLTIDYNLRRYTNEWRKKQGLKEINGDLPTLEANNQQQSQPQPQPSTPSQFTPPLPVHQQQIPSSMYPQQQPPPLQNVPQNNDKRAMTYDDLSGYFGMQMNSPKTGSSAATTSTNTNNTPNTSLTPVQLTNGYGNMMGSNLAQQHQQQQQQQHQQQHQNQNQHQQQQQQQQQQQRKSVPNQAQSAWESLIGTKNYDMMMTGSYNKNDMDQRPN